MTNTHNKSATLSSMLIVLEESFIFRKVFVLVRRSAELTLKPLGSSPYEKDKSLDHLYLTYCSYVRRVLLASQNRLNN